MAEFTGLIGTPSSGFTSKVVYYISQSIENNTSTVTAHGYVCKNKSSYYPYNSTSSVVMNINGNKGTDSPSYSFNGVAVGTYVHFISYTSPPISHNADGTKSITISFSVDGKLSNYYPYGTISKTIELPTIPRASSISSTSGDTIGSDMTVNISRHSTSFTHQLWYKIEDSDWIDLGTGIETSKSFTIDMDLCSHITTSTVGSLQLCLRTYNGLTQIGSDVYTKVSVNVPNSIVPTISSITVEETIYELNAKFGAFIQGKSKPKILINASGSYGSSILNYTTVIDSISYNGDSFICKTINKSGTIPIKTTIEDSRGRTATKTVNVTFIEYCSPSLTTFTINRCDSSGMLVNNGTYVKIVATGSIASCNSKNDNSYTIQYKKSSDTIWTTLLSGNSYLLDLNTVQTITGGFLTTVTYDFKVIYADYFTNTSNSKNLPTQFTLINYNSSGKGIAFGKVSEKDELEVALDSEFTGAVKMIGNHYVKPNYTGTANTTGYVSIAQINITGTYLNSPFIFEITGRDINMSTKIFVRFISNSTTDPSLASISYTGSVRNIYIAKTATGTWKLYVEKTNATDQITVNDFYTNTYNETRGFSISWINEFITELPDSYTKATHGEIVNNCTTTVEGYALDARQGTALRFDVDTIRTDLDSTNEKISNLTITTQFYNVTISANSYVSPYSYYGTYEIPSNDIDTYGEPISVTATGTNGAAVPVSFTSANRRWVTIVNTSSSAKIAVTYFKI